MIKTPTGWLHYDHYKHHYVQVGHWLEEPITRAVSQHMSIFPPTKKFPWVKYLKKSNLLNKMS